MVQKEKNGREDKKVSRIIKKKNHYNSHTVVRPKTLGTDRQFATLWHSFQPHFKLKPATVHRRMTFTRSFHTTAAEAAAAIPPLIFTFSHHSLITFVLRRQTKAKQTSSVIGTFFVAISHRSAPSLRESMVDLRRGDRNSKERERGDYRLPPQFFVGEFAKRTNVNRENSARNEIN